MAPEPPHLVGIPKPCPRPKCGSLDTKWRYFNNRKRAHERQPRYECIACGKCFQWGGRFRLSEQEKIEAAEEAEKAAMTEIALAEAARIESAHESRRARSVRRAMEAEEAKRKAEVEEASWKKETRATKAARKAMEAEEATRELEEKEAMKEANRAAKAARTTARARKVEEAATKNLVLEEGTRAAKAPKRLRNAAAKEVAKVEAAMKAAMDAAIKNSPYASPNANPAEATAQLQEQAEVDPAPPTLDSGFDHASVSGAASQLELNSESALMLNKLKIVQVDELRQAAGSSGALLKARKRNHTEGMQLDDFLSAAESSAAVVQLDKPHVAVAAALVNQPFVELLAVAGSFGSCLLEEEIGAETIEAVGWNDLAPQERDTVGYDNSQAWASEVNRL